MVFSLFCAAGIKTSILHKGCYGVEFKFGGHGPLCH